MEADANARVAEAEAKTVDDVVREVMKNGSKKTQEKSGQQ